MLRKKMKVEHATGSWCLRLEKWQVTWAIKDCFGRYKAQYILNFSHIFFSENVRSQLIVILDTNPVWWGQKPSSHTKAQQKVGLVFGTHTHTPHICFTCLRFKKKKQTCRNVLMISYLQWHAYITSIVFFGMVYIIDDVNRVFRFCYGVCSLSLNDESFQQTGRNSCPLWSKVSKNFICIGDLIEYWGFSFKKQKILKSP